MMRCLLSIQLHASLQADTSVQEFILDIDGIQAHGTPSRHSIVSPGEHFVDKSQALELQT